MAQLLILEPDKRRIYQPIASIRDYSEPDFEDKLFKYSKDLFDNYYTLKFKFTISKKSDLSERYQPDLLLISKNFKRWIFIEVELCKPDLSHTFRQIDTFLDPYFDPDEVIRFIIKHNHELKTKKDKLEKLIKTDARAPELLVVFDDYNKKVFEKIDSKYKKLNVCVLEVYKEPNNKFGAYRLGGKYPYDIFKTSKIVHFDHMHFTIEKPDVIEAFEPGEIELLYDMTPMRGTLIKPSRKNSKCMLKIVEHNFESTDMLQLAIDYNNKLIIQTL